MIWKEFWLENVMVRCSGDHMEFWLGIQQNDVAWSTRRVRGQVMCGSGVLVGLVDSRVLKGVETKVVGSCAPRRPR